MWLYSARCLDHGIIPLWNPYNNFGTPFLANIQTCVFYPLTFLFHLGDFTRFFNLYILLHLTLSSFFTFLWMRDCRASKSASFISGVAFGLSGYLMSAINLTISLCSAAYLPLALLCFRRALKDKRFFWKGLTALVLALQLLAGDPAVIFAMLFVFFVFAAFKSVEKSLALRSCVFEPLISLAQIGLTLLGLAAFQLLMFAEFLSKSIRMEQTFRESTMWSMRINDLLAVVVPYFSDLSMYVMEYWNRQSWLENYYAGASVFALALVAIFSNKSKIVRYHFLLGWLGLALSLGGFSGIYWILYKCVPLFSFVRYPVRFFFLLSFSLACLAGFGLDALVHLRRRAGIWTFPAFAVFVLFFILFFDKIEHRVSGWAETCYGENVRSFYTLPVLRNFVYVAMCNIKRTFIYWLLIMIGGWAAASTIARRQLIVFFMGLVVFLDLYSSNIIEPRIPAYFLLKPSRNIAFIQKDNEKNGLFRVLSSPKTIKNQFHRAMIDDLEDEQDQQKDRLTLNLVLPYRLFSALGYDSIFLMDTYHLQEYFKYLKSPDTPFLDLLNIKYVVSANADLTDHFVRVRKGEPVNLFLNKRVLPRAFLVRQAVPYGESHAFIRSITARDFDPTEKVYVEGLKETPEEIKNIKGVEKSPGVTFLDYGPNEVKMKAVVSDRPWLFFSDTFYPGWKAWVDRMPAKIYKANFAFRALYLSPGEHEIVWKYDPVLFKIGSVITLLTAAWLLFYFSRRRTA